MQETVINVNKEKLVKLSNELAYPVLLLDKEYKICYKNDFCLNRILPLRMGSCIKNRLTPSEFRRLLQQKSGEIITVSIEMASFCSVFVYRSDDYYLLGFRALTSSLQNRINELMKLNFDYTEALLCQMNTLATDNAEIGIAELIKKKSNRILRSQRHIGEFLSIINGIKSEKTRLCDVDAILNAIIPSLRDTLRPLGIQISYTNGSESIESRCANICEPDFNMILCLILYNTIRISQSGKIQVNINVINEKLYITMLTDSVLSEKTAKFIGECDLEQESFTSPDGWMYFELLLIKRLCEYYLWDLRMSAPKSDYTRIQSTFSIPLEHVKPPDFIVRECESAESERKGIIAIEFANLFDRE